MASKQAKNAASKAKKPAKAEEKREDVLQAVVSITCVTLSV
jgi:hypothetical protein